MQTHAQLTDDTYCYSIETFNQTVLNYGREATQLQNWNDPPQLLLKYRQSTPVTDNLERCKERLEEVTEELHERLYDQVEDHPRYLQVTQLCEEVLDDGWTESSQAAWLELEAQAERAKARLDNLYLTRREWSWETYVADHLLEQGVNLFVEALDDLRRALPDQEKAEQELEWMAEAVFFLVAVKTWERDHCAS